MRECSSLADTNSVLVSSPILAFN